jgi:hypothetical protein
MTDESNSAEQRDIEKSVREQINAEFGFSLQTSGDRKSGDRDHYAG